MSVEVRGRTLYLGTSHEGVDVTYNKSRRVIVIGGWYDGCVGIQATEMTLTQFLTLLKVPSKDVARCGREMLDG